MLAETVGGKAAGNQVESWLSMGNYIENEGTCDGTGNLSINVISQFLGWKSIAGLQADRDGRVDMTAGNRTDCINHDHHGQPESQGDPMNPIPIRILFPGPVLNTAAGTAVPQPQKN
jgi:hypothetical protein